MDTAESVLSIEDYLKLSKEERVKLYLKREAEHIRLAKQAEANDMAFEPEELKKLQDDAKKKVILPCWWLSDPELKAAAESMGVSPYRCPYLDRERFACNEFENGWMDCEEMALKFKIKSTSRKFLHTHQTPPSSR